MATQQFTTLSPAAAAVGVKNRLSRDLDELKRAAAAAGTLPMDEAGNLFDLSVSLHQAVQALTTAITDCDRYISATRPAPAPAVPFCFFCPDADHDTAHCPKVDAEGIRQAKLQAARQAADLLNECFA